MFGMASVESRRWCREKSTTATTPVLPAHCRRRGTNSFRYTQASLESFCFFLFYTVVTFYQTDWLRLAFACRGFVLDTTMEIEASAVMLTSCVPSKEVWSCLFSSCLGMLPVSKLFNEAHHRRPVEKLPFGRLLTKYCLSSKNKKEAGI